MLHTVYLASHYNVCTFRTGFVLLVFFLQSQHNAGDNKTKGVGWEIEVTAGDVPSE